MNRSRSIVVSALLSVVIVCVSACQRAPEVASTEAPADAVAAPSPPDPIPEMPKSPLPAIESLLRPGDTLASARTRLGAANVVARELAGAEGETFQGWVLYPDDPQRSIEAMLDEEGAHPEAIRVAGDQAKAWTRADGVRIGLSSVELETLNGQPYDFSGFDWDYGGNVLDWHGGALDPGDGVRGGVTLCSPADAPQDYPMGDAVFSSSDARMQAHPARVCAFVVAVAAG